MKKCYNIIRKFKQKEWRDTMTLLLHKDIFCPEDIIEKVIALQRNIKFYKISNHLYERNCLKKKIDAKHNYTIDDIVSLLYEIKMFPKKPIEVEIKKDDKSNSFYISKFCIRADFNATTDMSIVLAPIYNKKDSTFFTNKFFIRTAWLNSKFDNHSSLDKTKYCSEVTFNECRK